MAANPTAGGSDLKTSIPSVHASSAPSEPSATSTNHLSNRKKSPDPRHLTIALHHARHIQARKDTEAAILSHIENLIDFPTSDGASVTSPSLEDVTTLKSALLPFQPSDYDNLILERNIDGRCGYALCPKEHRKEDPKAKARIIWGPKGSGPGGRGKEMKIVPREKLEMWCADECAERAMYIRVQLNETPAWERTGGGNVGVKLFDEARQSKTEKSEGADTEMEREMQNLAIGDRDVQDPDRLAAELDTLDVRGESSSANRARQLAFERDTTQERTGVHIVEKEGRTSTTVSAPTPDVHTSHGGSIEGFGSKSRSELANMEVEDEDDMLPYI